MSRKYSTFSRTSLPLPPTDVRVNPNQKEPWSVFSQQHKDVLQIYYLVVNNLLSHSEGINMDDLSSILRFDYLTPTSLIKDFINFITWNETTDIQFQEPLKGVRSRVVYAYPRSESPSIVGSFSRWMPH
jgi:hypothetical protein